MSGGPIKQHESFPAFYPPKHLASPTGFGGALPGRMLARFSHRAQ